MRIIAGSARRHPVEAPPHLTRPTADRVREAVFSTLGDRVPGTHVLDLFAGSGSLGLEALSRGAASATFVDDAAAAARTIERNLEQSRLAGGNVRRGDAFAFLRGAPAAAYGLVFADPPYARDEATKRVVRTLLESKSLSAAMEAGGLLVLESLRGVPVPESGHWIVANSKIYGKTRITYLHLAE